MKLNGEELREFIYMVSIGLAGGEAEGKANHRFSDGTRIRKFGLPGDKKLLCPLLPKLRLWGTSSSISVIWFRAVEV